MVDRRSRLVSRGGDIAGFFWRPSVLYEGVGDDSDEPIDSHIQAGHEPRDQHSMSFHLD